MTRRRKVLALGRNVRSLGRILATTGLRSGVERIRLRRRTGLISLGTPPGYELTGTTFAAGCRLGGPAFVVGCDVGAHSYIEVGCRISRTRIGRYCSIAPDCVVGLAEHPAHFVSTHPRFYRHLPHLGYDLVQADAHQEIRPTTLGNDVWLGAQAIVRGGVHIADGAIVGAGAVVTTDVPAYAVVAGVPARVLRYRFDEETRERLERSRWWDRDDAWLRRHAHLMGDVPAFLAACEVDETR